MNSLIIWNNFLIADVTDGYISDIELDEAHKARVASPERRMDSFGSPRPIELQPTASQQSTKRSQSARLTALKVGDKYEIVLEKINNSLGLNVTVSLDVCNR